MKTILMFVAMISCTVVANLLLKTGATAEEVRQTGVAGLLNWRVLLGLAAFGSGAVIYLLLLRWIPLNVAQSFAAAQFVAVILASAVVLSEPIRTGQWVGIALIAVGITVVGWTRA